jgi:hypothetical protein
MSSKLRRVNAFVKLRWQVSLELRLLQTQALASQGREELGAFYKLNCQE